MPIYYHPFRFLQNAEEARPPVDWEEVESRLVEKYRYQGKNVLRFDETRLTVQEVIHLINDAELHERHHRKLLLMDDLLAFLEKGKLGFFKNEREWQAFTDANFVEWLRPYFTKRYNLLLKKAITSTEMTPDYSFVYALDSKFNLPESYVAPCCEGINFIIMDKARQLARIARDGYYLMRPFQTLSVDSRQILRHFKASYGDIFSKLPREALPAINDYAEAIQQIHKGIMMASDNDIGNINPAQLKLTEAIADCHFKLNGMDQSSYYRLKGTYHNVENSYSEEEKREAEREFEAYNQEQLNGYRNVAAVIIILMMISLILVYLLS